MGRTGVQPSNREKICDNRRESAVEGRIQEKEFRMKISHGGVRVYIDSLEQIFFTCLLIKIQ